MDFDRGWDIDIMVNNNMTNLMGQHLQGRARGRDKDGVVTGGIKGEEIDFF